MRLERTYSFWFFAMVVLAVFCCGGVAYAQQSAQHSQSTAHEPGTVAPEWKTDHFVEETITPDASSDQAIVPTEHETVAFAMPGTGWLLGFQDIGEVKTVLEFVPAGHTINDWREVVSFQTFRVVKDVTPEEFAGQIAGHWKKNCKSVDSSILRKWKRDGYDAILGLTDCTEASYSLVPEYMMYLIIRGKTRLHLVQRSIRGRDIKVNQDAWIKFFDAVSVCPRVKGVDTKCLPKNNLNEVLEKVEEHEKVVIPMVTEKPAENNAKPETK